jgi:hypothetical protein
MLTCHLPKPWFHTESNCSRNKKITPRNKNITPRNKNTAGNGGVFFAFLSSCFFLIPSAARDRYNVRLFSLSRAQRGVATIFDLFLSRSGARDHYNLRPLFLSRAQRGICFCLPLKTPANSIRRKRGIVIPPGIVKREICFSRYSRLSALTPILHPLVILSEAPQHSFPLQIDWARSRRIMHFSLLYQPRLFGNQDIQTPRTLLLCLVHSRHGSATSL